MSELSLVVLAAGIGSRYGGMKQAEGMGPGGETLLDYSVYDARRAGFTAERLAADRECVARFGGRTFHTQSDHHAPDYPELLRIGLGGLRNRAVAVREAIRDHDVRGTLFLDSVIEALDGAGAHLRRAAAQGW